MMSGYSYHLYYLQILESERCLKLSSVLNIFSQQSDSPSIQTFIKSFTSPDNINTDDDDDFIILDPFLEDIGDLSSI